MLRATVPFVSCLLVFAACRCSGIPSHVVTIGDASFTLAQQVCANTYAFCPASVPDGGEPACEGVVNARLGLTPATMLPVLNCEAQAMSKAAFVVCGGVAACP